MSRRSAVALIVNARTTLLANHDDRPPADTERQPSRVADLTRLLFDVRAGRVSEFEMRHPAPMYVIVSSD
ncbi:hypothetical protein [Paraburkholderia sp. J67]|uniref:hypothetical protein n=1 Tax=Paraburkholderia sp. J67 TaxID=2805435 RepID=UPI002ABDAAEA|nr:hypothetical protein [Paraburkholderia sp. J67]